MQLRNDILYTLFFRSSFLKGFQVRMPCFWSISIILLTLDKKTYQHLAFPFSGKLAFHGWNYPIVSPGIYQQYWKHGTLATNWCSFSSMRLECALNLKKLAQSLISRSRSSQSVFSTTFTLNNRLK